MNRENALIITEKLMKTLEENGVTYDEAKVIADIFADEVANKKETAIKQYTASSLFHIQRS